MATIAVGEVINYCADIADAVSVDFRPASGVECCILSCSSEQNDCEMAMTQGTIQAIFWYRLSVTNNWNINGNKFFINNTNYLRISNFSGYTGALSYSGIQIK